MNQKLELVRENLKTPVTVTGKEILAGGMLCLAAGIILGLFLGMAGKGISLKIALGSYNGSRNRNNGNGNCDNGRKSYTDEKAGKSE